jgi:hypothetical protein
MTHSTDEFSMPACDQPKKRQGRVQIANVHVEIPAGRFPWIHPVHPAARRNAADRKDLIDPEWPHIHGIGLCPSEQVE